jgi:hypothetical protein
VFRFKSLLGGSLLAFNLTLASNSPTICTQDLNQLTQQLLIDLPDYTNRVIRRAQTLDRSDLLVRHVIVASKPEFDPIPLPQRQYTQVFTDSPTQIFFTTLERRYIQAKPVETQGFHWLFLVETEKGWDFLLLLSSNQSQQVSIPPRESNQTAIASAIRLWLRDYQSSCN